MKNTMIKFTGNLPPIQSSIRIGQDGARIQIDVPETELSKILPLLMWRDRALKITIEPQE